MWDALGWMLGVRSGVDGRTGISEDRWLTRSIETHVTVELACRLLEGKALLRTEVAAALHDASMRGIAFVESLVDRIPGALGILETEFSRWSGPLTSSTKLDEALMARLPAGMCERLLAAPLAERDAAETIRLAVVDPYDAHVLAEVSYCLSAAVTPVRIAYATLVQALNARQKPGNVGAEALYDVPDDDTPAFGTRRLRVARKSLKPPSVVSTDLALQLSLPPRRGFTVPPIEAPKPPSELPIPLVRTSLAPSPRMDAGANPSQAVSNGPERRDSEPVLRLVKQKPSLSFRRVSLPPPGRPADRSEERPEDSLARLEQVQSPRQLIELLRELLARVAPCQAYFSLRAGRHVLEWASGPPSPKRGTLTPDQETILRRACQEGYFFGPLPPDGGSDALGATLGLRAREEIYVAPVNVIRRPALIIVVGRFDESFAATRWVDSVSARASQVLERLARKRK